MLATTIDALHAEFGGAPADGSLGLLKVGAEVLELMWVNALGIWASEPEPHAQLRVDWHHNASGAVTPDTLAYLYKPLGGAGNIGQSSFGWNACPIYEPSLKYGAGLALYERSCGYYWSFTPGDDQFVWTVLYAMNDGVQIAGTIDPSTYKSLSMKAKPGVRTFCDTGWVKSPLTPPAGTDLWAPHLYSQYTVAGTTGTLESWTLTSFERCWGGDPS